MTTTSSPESTEDLQRAVAESTAAAAEAQAELDRRAAEAQAAARAEEEAADRKRLANARRVEEALEQLGRNAAADFSAGAEAGDLPAVYSGHVRWLGSREARRIHRDDLANASARTGEPNPYPAEVRAITTTFAEVIEAAIPAAAYRAGLEQLDQIGYDH